MTCPEAQKNQLVSDLLADAKVGRKVQRHFMPAEQATLENYSLSLRVHARMPISGDFIDYIDLGAGLLLFAVLDVSGHGAGAGLITLLAKQSIHRKAHELHQSSKNDALNRSLEEKVARDGVASWPARVVSSLNQDLLALNSPCHATGVIGIVDRQLHQLYYAVAGHYPYPMLIGCQSSVPMSGNEKPVGLFPHAAWENRSIPFEAGQHLAVLTDGIWPFVRGSSTLEKEGCLLDWLSSLLLAQNNAMNLFDIQRRMLSAFDQLVGWRAENSMGIVAKREGGDLIEKEPVDSRSLMLPDTTLQDDVSLLVLSRGR